MIQIYPNRMLQVTRKCFDGASYENTNVVPTNPEVLAIGIDRHNGWAFCHRDMHGKASLQILEMDLHPDLRPCNLKRMSIYEVFVCENGPRNVVFTFENKKLPNLGTLASHAVQLALSMVQFGFRCMRFMGKLHHFDHFGFDLHSCRCRCS